VSAHLQIDRVLKLFDTFERAGTLDPLRVCTGLQILYLYSNSLQGTIQRMAIGALIVVMVVVVGACVGA
jgi:hypothetical protein